MEPDFRLYIQQVKKNAQVLADELIARGYLLVTGGTENHLLLWDLRPQGITGSKMEKLCDFCEITLNKNTVPGDKSALSPGGLRIGTPAMTTRGFQEPEMVRLAELLDRLVKHGLEIQSETGKKMVDFEAALPKHEELLGIRNEVNSWAREFPLPLVEDEV